jgi:hypothetical protein
MSEPRKPRTAFPLRFENERTRDMLRLVAEQQGTSMNQLAGEMIERELEVLALGLEVSLTRTMELLAAYRGEGRAEAWDAFAEAEGLPDPVRVTRTDGDADRFGIAQAFGVEA